MRLAKENLGKVSVTVEKTYHSVDKEYDKLVVVEEKGQFRTFISRKPVPIGTELTDREFWLPFSSVKESIVIDYNKFKQYIRTGEGLLDDSIVTRHIKDRNVTGDKIAEATITFVNIANEAVTLSKINKEAIDTTLTKEGHLAEAKHTGDRLLNIEGLSVIKVPSTQSTVLDAWQIIDKKGNVHGVTINTYKDKSIDAIWLSVHEDDPKPEDSEVKVDNPRYLNIVYNKADGTKQKVSIPLASFVTEAEFSKNGFKVIDGVVNLKISSDITTSRYFHFDADGNITLDGFEERILEDLGTLEHSESGDGTMWGEFKKQEAIREEVSDSTHQVFSDNWDAQDDDPEDYDPLAVTEASFAYNWKSVTNPNKTGNIEDLVNKVNALAVGIFYGYYPNKNELPQDITEKGYAYVGIDNPYKIYNFDGSQWKDSGTTIQATSEVDEEDITYNENNKLTFKDRNNTDGMGYVILRKDKSFAEQVTKENTIYEIRYDFTLEDSITIPTNCILRFNGGSLKNGTLIGNRTIIKCTSNSIFKNIHIDGNWIVPNIYSKWFIDIHEENKLNELINLCNSTIHNTVYIADTEEPYMVSVKVDRGAGLIVNKANTEIILKGTIKMIPNKFPNQDCVLISESNVSINGGGKIIGDKDEHDYTTISGTHEYGHGIDILGMKTSWSDAEIIYNISICNIEVTNCAGDCICFGWAQKININNVYLHNARRQGISGTNYTGEIYITNFKITNIHGTSPSSGIDLELDNDSRFYGRNYVIENGYIADCALGICISKNNSHVESTSNNASIKNITFVNEDENFVDCFIKGCLLFTNNSNVNVQNIICTKENVQFFECRNSHNIIVTNAIGGHIIIFGGTYGITFNNSNFSSNSSLLIKDESFFSNSEQSINIVFNNCKFLSTNYHFCFSVYPKNKRIQFNNCDIDAETLVVMNENTLYFYGCNILLTNKTQTGEFHDCNIKVVTKDQTPIKWISSYNSIFDIIMNCPSSSSFPNTVGEPFSFSANNIVFKDNIITIKSDLAKPLFSLLSIGEYTGHPFTNIKIINNKFIIDMDEPLKVNTVYRAFIGPNSGIVVSNYSLYNNQGLKTSRPNLKLVLNNRLSYSEIGTLGFKYYDTTLNKTIIWNGTNWVDESNNIVTYPITFNLTNLTSNNFITPDKESQYTFKLKAYTNYTLPSNITVKMGTKTLINDTDYTYNSSTGDVVILGTNGNGGVTAALTITANGISI